jgi:hypothetical protein
VLLPSNVALPIVMHNGRRIAGEGPGLPAGSEDVARVHGWDWDGEGFGNPRIEARSGFAVGDPVSPGFYGAIDIGADEMGELIMAGYTPSTRIYTDADFPGAGPTAIAHDIVVYFNLLAPGTYPRPHYSSETGDYYNWYWHAQGWPDINPATANLTSAPAPFPNDILFLSSIGHPLAMRGLNCDFSPALFPDPHRYWALLMWLTSPTLFPPHPYAANCWHADSNILPFSVDNPFVYNNFTSMESHGSVYAGVLFSALGLGVFFNTAIVDATLNPPGTFAKSAIGTYLLFPVGTFGAFPPCTSAGYSIGPWGFGDVAPGCPDSLPFLATWPELGVRCNCELPVGFGNLQSFLVVADHPDQGPVDPPATTGAAQSVVEGFESSAERVAQLKRAYEALFRSMGGGR